MGGRCSLRRGSLRLWRAHCREGKWDGPGLLCRHRYLSLSGPLSGLLIPATQDRTLMCVHNQSVFLPVAKVHGQPNHDQSFLVSMEWEQSEFNELISNHFKLMSYNSSITGYVPNIEAHISTSSHRNHCWKELHLY